MFHETFGRGSASWAGRTYADIADVADRDGSVAIVPVGSVEQHGPHLAVATDTILADAVAHAGVERARVDVPTLVTPPLWAGLSAHHLPFGGTFSLGFDQLLGLAESIGGQALEQGFDALLLLNGHGGNAALVDAAVTAVGREHPQAETLGLTYFSLAEPFVDEIRDSEPGGIMHAGEFETSLMLHVRPDLVDETALEASYVDTPYELGDDDLFDRGSLSRYSTYAEHTDTGVRGDPTPATAAKGEELMDRLGERLAALLEAVHDEAAAPAK